VQSIRQRGRFVDDMVFTVTKMLVFTTRCSSLPGALHGMDSLSRVSTYLQKGPRHISAQACGD
jgi:hypothetical protein